VDGKQGGSHRDGSSATSRDAAVDALARPREAGLDAAGSDAGDAKAPSVPTTLCIDGNAFSLASHDEFNRDSVLPIANAPADDAGLWFNEYCYDRLNTGLDGNDDSYYPSTELLTQWQLPPVVSLSDGGAHINAYPVPAAHLGDSVLCDDGVACRGHLAGFLSAQAPYSYKEGYWEFKAAVPSSTGFWPALWLVNNTCAGSYNEVDVLEVFPSCGPNEARQTLQLDNDAGQHANGGPFVDLDAAAVSTMHTYSALVTSTSVVFYFDGAATSTRLRRSPASESAPLSAILNLETFAAHAFCPAPPDGGSASMLVEHYRYYAPTGQTCSHDDLPGPKDAGTEG
jgi:hypothetical protein